MPSYNGNGIFLTIGGTDVGAQFKTVNIERKVDTEDVTAGRLRTDMQRAPKLLDTSIGITLAYDVTGINTYVQRLKPGRYTVVFGPEGNTTGKPRHQQDFIFTSSPIEVTVGKGEVVFDIKGDAADAPTFDIWNGDVF